MANKNSLALIRQLGIAVRFAFGLNSVGRGGVTLSYLSGTGVFTGYSRGNWATTAGSSHRGSGIFPRDAPVVLLGLVALVAKRQQSMSSMSIRNCQARF